MTLTHQGDLLRVTAEGCYVLLDPVQRCNEVEQCVVSGSIAVLRTQETFKQTIATRIFSYRVLHNIYSAFITISLCTLQSYTECSLTFCRVITEVFILQV